MGNLRTWLRFDWGWVCRTGKRWQLWKEERQGIAVGAQLLVHSICIDGVQQLAASVSGALFNECASVSALRAHVPAGGDVDLEVESLSQERLPFLGYFDMESDARRGMHEILPIPQVILEPHERRIIMLRVIRAGVIDGLVIPSFVPKPKGEA